MYSSYAHYGRAGVLGLLMTDLATAATTAGEIVWLDIYMFPCHACYLECRSLVQPCPEAGYVFDPAIQVNLKVCQSYRRRARIIRESERDEVLHFSQWQNQQLKVVWPTKFVEASTLYPARHPPPQWNAPKLREALNR